ncbi:MarR family winged helix-turn-helix transcriptional regulator [Nesterenkonia cremea]|uniref:HTH marR-type domain-containing protein n=1 Tax=Nesterenkonia cremea TaxID=1882340 RepID=A0A917AVG1_9MICC|nr:MarR family transcriptional regulator [Nesterenkonia cremea]GGE76756.1 hypothetical protein GCM10011401_25150 [Nesterenkonia cremea]
MLDPAAPDSPALRTLQAIQLLTDALDRMHSDLTRRMEMHTSDLRALRMLAIREQQGTAVTPHAIAEHLGITTAAATSLIDRLVRDRFVQRARHPEDGRSRIITLTPKARQHFFAHFSRHLSVMQELIGATDTTELNSIAGFLEALSERIADPDSGRSATPDPDAGQAASAHSSSHPGSRPEPSTQPRISKDSPSS